MTTNKGANRTFLITVIVYVLFSLFWPIAGNYFGTPFYLDIALAQLIVFLPAFFYIKIAGMKVGELIPYRKIKISDALLAVVMTYLFYPLLVVMNLLTMFFFNNTTAEMTTVMQEQNMLWNILFIAVLPACVEEFVFRGMLYQTYRKSSLWKGILLSAFLFGCMHMNFNQFLYTFVFGIILAMTVEATGSILTSMLCHFILNLNSVLLVAVTDRMQGGELENVVSESSSLMDNPRMLLMGTISWIVIAVFTTAGAMGIWIHLAKKNGRLETFRTEWKEPAKEKLFSIPLLIGILLAVAVMALIEIVSRL